MTPGQNHPGRSRGRPVVAGLLVAALIAPGVARAAPGRVVVAPTRSQGDIDPDVGALFERRLLEGLGTDGIEVVRSDRTEPCSDAGCFVALAEAADGRYVLALAVSARERVYQISVSLLDAADGSKLHEQTDLCEICGAEEVGAQIRSAAAAVREQLESISAGQPRLVVTSVPTGATVLIDGVEVGSTPLDLGVEAGTHVVRITAPGRVAQERELLLVEGGRQSVSVDLGTPVRSSDPTVPTQDASPAGRPLVIAGSVVLGASLATVAAGAAMLAIDGRQNESRCTGDDIDVNGRCRYSYQTQTLGIGLLAGAGVGLVVGAALLGVGLSRRKRARTSARAEIRAGGAGVALRF